jgi:hypothetical protein
MCEDEGKKHAKEFFPNIKILEWECKLRCCCVYNYLSARVLFDHWVRAAAAWLESTMLLSYVCVWWEESSTAEPLAPTTVFISPSGIAWEMC